MTSAAQALDRWNPGLAGPLARTVEYVREQIPYYRGILSGYEPGALAEQLSQIPVLTKGVAIKRKDQLRATPERGIIGRFSTGTTRHGRGFFDVRTTTAESRAIEAFFRSGRSFGVACDPRSWTPEGRLEVAEKGVTPEALAPAPVRVLSIESQHYEVFPKPREPGVVQVAWNHHANCIQSVRELLSLGRDEGGFGLLRVEPGPLAKLTLLLAQGGFAFESCGIEVIGIHGYLSPRWRRFFEETWRAQVVEVFSLSEVRSAARECEAGGHFHFDELPIITEVLDPSTQLHLAEGWGELVLTSLYPFAQEQPLLRYATGDLIRVVPCERHPELGFRWEGRLHHAIPRSEGICVGERAFMDALDAIPDVARSADDFERLGLIPAGTVGWPEFRLEHTTPEIRVHVSLRYVPAVFKDRARAVEAQLRSALEEARVDLPPVPIEVILHGPSEDTAGLSDWWSFARSLHPFLSLAR